MREVVAATRQGEKALARNLLRQVQEEDPNNEQALMWAAALAETPEEATAHLERVLQLNPNNQQAINVLAMHRLNPPAARPPAAQPKPAEPAAAAPPHHAPEPVPPPAPRLEPPAPPRPGPQPVPPPASLPQPSPKPAPPAASASDPAPRVLHFQNLLKKGWNCPLCETPAPQIQRKCPRCGGLLALDDLHALADNRGADEKLLYHALEKWTRKAHAEPSFDTWLNLARIHFNLNRSAEALGFLKKACELKPGETTLHHLAAKLQERRLVLAVDDSLTLRRVLAIMLERHGFRVLTAADGMQALALLNDQVPDLILLDITMPRMDGYQVCKVIKQNPYTRHIPVVMLSGNDGFFDKVKGKLAGATDYITKPFEEKALADSVEKHLLAGRKANR